MIIVTVWILGQIALFLILLWLAISYFDKRYKKRPENLEGYTIPPGYERTNEVFIDPSDGHRYRVYCHPRTGEREYIREE